MIENKFTYSLTRLLTHLLVGPRADKISFNGKTELMQIIKGYNNYNYDNNNTNDNDNDSGNEKRKKQR